MIWNTSELSASHLSPATAIFGVDYCQFGPSLIFGLKMELMACSDLVGGITEKSCIFPDLTCNYQWYELLLNYMHHTSTVPQPFLLLMAANLALPWFLGWQLSLWPVPAWLGVQQRKYVLFLTLHVSISDMKHFWTFCITTKPWHSHFCCWWLPIWL